MEKFNTNGSLLPGRFLFKLFLTMKITFILIVAATLTTLASVSYSQSARVSLNLRNVTVKDALKAIETKSEFFFIYNNELIDVNRKININATDQRIDEILNTLFAGHEIDINLIDRKIVLAPSDIAAAVQQQRGVSGTVTDRSGSPLPGVTVVAKGTTTGTITNADGIYSIGSILPDATLVFSFVGMKTIEVPIAGKNTINIQLEEETLGVDEVVVIGYGTRSKRDVTTAISYIGTESLDKSITMSPEFAMQGRMTGVQIAGNSGNPMTRPSIRIRGVNTWGVSSPLFIIDGIPITEMGSGIEGQEDARASDVRGPLNIMSMIDPNDIESISVLKDASAAAIYGVRAANGVILITTKKGKAQKPTVEFSSRFGIQNITSRLDVMNTEQYAKHLQNVYASDPTVSVSPENVGVYDPSSPNFLGNSPTYDWQEAIKNKNAPTQDYSVRISGGTEKTDFYLGSNFSETEGTLVGSSLQRYSGSIKLNTQINDWLKLGVNYRISSASGKDNSWEVTYWQVAQTPPWQPIYDTKGPYGYAPTVPGLGSDGIYRSTKLYGVGTRFNVLGVMDAIDENFKSLRNMGNFYLEIEPVKKLKIKGSISMDKYENNRNSFDDYDVSVFRYTDGDPRTKGGGNSVGGYGELISTNNNIVKEITLNYANSLGLHNFDILFNGMDQQYDSKYIGLGTEYMTTKLPYLRILGGENKFTSIQSGLGRWALQGLLGRIGYNFGYKYYLDITARRDGSARFAPENRWGTFPSVSAAWRINEEAFMENVDWLNNMKLRVGWGQLGNQEVRNMAYLSAISTKPSYAWGDSGNGYGYFSTAATVFGMANRGLQWEKTSTTNIGVDAVVFDRLNLSIEYYNKLTKGILQEVSLPFSTGVTEQPVDNIASVRNSGFELSLNYSGEVGQFMYNIGGNISTNKNVVEETYKDIPLWNIEKGYPLFYAKGYKLEGTFQNQEEINEWMAKYADSNYQNTKVAPGDFYFKDVRGAPINENEFYSEGPDGKIDNYDQVYIGKTIPGYFYGLNADLMYKRFDMSIQFTGVGDVVKYNSVKRAMLNMQSVGDNISVEVLNAWTPTNTNTSLPRVIAGDPASNLRNSDFWFEDASYLRLSNLQVGYTFSKSFYEMTNGNIQNARIYAGASNLFTITNYSGLDPENDKFPAPRVIFMGLNVKF
jgi:TonB-dependent starch-binding outer membrane protein SusC